MIRFSMMLLLIVGFSYVSLFAQEEKKANPKVGEIFEKMDADKDGKLTKEEFSKYFEDLMSRLPKGGNKIGNFSDRIFDRLDGDKDGKLTKEEFEKFGGGFGALGEGKFDKEKLKELMEKFKNRKKDN